MNANQKRKKRKKKADSVIKITIVCDMLSTVHYSNQQM